MASRCRPRKLKYSKTPIPQTKRHRYNTTQTSPCSANHINMSLSSRVISQVARATRTYSTGAPVSRPKKIGALRGGFTGFLLGATATGAASYYYLLDEFTKSNNVILLDLLKLNETVQNLEKHVRTLEENK